MLKKWQRVVCGVSTLWLGILEMPVAGLAAVPEDTVTPGKETQVQVNYVVKALDSDGKLDQYVSASQEFPEDGIPESNPNLSFMNTPPVIGPEYVRDHLRQVDWVYSSVTQAKLPLNISMYNTANKLVNKYDQSYQPTLGGHIRLRVPKDYYWVDDPKISKVVKSKSAGKWSSLTVLSDEEYKILAEHAVTKPQPGSEIPPVSMPTPPIKQPGVLHPGQPSLAVPNPRPKVPVITEPIVGDPITPTPTISGIDATAPSQIPEPTDTTPAADMPVMPPIKAYTHTSAMNESNQGRTIPQQSRPARQTTRRPVPKSTYTGISPVQGLLGATSTDPNKSTPQRTPNTVPRLPQTSEHSNHGRFWGMVFGGLGLVGWAYRRLRYKPRKHLC